MKSLLYRATLAHLQVLRTVDGRVARMVRHCRCKGSCRFESGPGLQRHQWSVRSSTGKSTRLLTGGLLVRVQSDVPLILICLCCHRAVRRHRASLPTPAPRAERQCSRLHRVRPCWADGKKGFLASGHTYPQIAFPSWPSPTNTPHAVSSALYMVCSNHLNT